MRKEKFYIALILILLAACSSPEPTPVIETELSPYQVILVSSDYALGEARVSFTLFDGAEAAEGITAVSLAAFPVGVEVTEPAWTGTAVNYTDYLIPYWVIFPDLT